MSCCLCLGRGFCGRMVAVCHRCCACRALRCRARGGGGRGVRAGRGSRREGGLRHRGHGLQWLQRLRASCQSRHEVVVVVGVDCLGRGAGCVRARLQGRDHVWVLVGVDRGCWGASILAS